MYIYNNDVNRNFGIDVLKVIAVLFVIILHLDNIYINANNYDILASSVKFTWMALESISYPAVNMFVLAGSYMMCDKHYTKMSSILKVYFTTLVVTILGLAICAVLHIKLTGIDIFKVFAPFSFRAYGYVSSYIVLMLIFPFINILLKKLSDRELYVITFYFSLIVIIYPSVIPFSGWGENYTELFFCLYFIAASIRRINSSGCISKNKLRLIGIVVWCISLLVLFSFPFVIDYLSAYISKLIKIRNHCFSYHNIFVVLESVGALIFLLNIKYKYRKNLEFIGRIIYMISNSSLFIYIYHMHPILKKYYYDIPYFHNLYFYCGIDYFCFVFTLAVLIVICGIAIHKLLIYYLVDNLVKKMIELFKSQTAERLLTTLKIENR